MQPTCPACGLSVMFKYSHHNGIHYICQQKKNKTMVHMDTDDIQKLAEMMAHIELINAKASPSLVLGDVPVKTTEGELLGHIGTRAGMIVFLSLGAF